MQRSVTANSRLFITAMLAAGILYLLVTFTASMVVETNQLANSDAPLLEVVKIGPLDIPENVFSSSPCSL